MKLVRKKIFFGGGGVGEIINMGVKCQVKSAHSKIHK